MRRVFSRALGAGLLLAALGGEAEAQFGWGGWGSTVQGNIARGLGVLDAGAGLYNVNTAAANSINTDTATRWNQAMWESQQALNRTNYIRRMRRKSRINMAQAQIYDRLRNHPETRDIVDGDALNVLLDIYQNPSVSSTAIRSLRDPLAKDVIRDIPFEYASEALTICLDQFTERDGWPLGLRGKALEPQRRRVELAVDEALDEDEKGTLTTETIQALSAALTALHQAFVRAVPRESPDYIPARDHIRTLFGLTRMLHSPKAEELLAQLEKYEGTTVADLLAFMQAFNLRFAPANSFRQRQIYLGLYPVLASRLGGPLANVTGDVEKGLAEAARGAEGAVARGESSLGRAASSLFRGFDLDNGEGKAAPRP